MSPGQGKRQDRVRGEEDISVYSANHPIQQWLNAKEWFSLLQLVQVVALLFKGIRVLRVVP